MLVGVPPPLVLVPGVGLVVVPELVPPVVPPLVLVPDDGEVPVPVEGAVVPVLVPGVVPPPVLVTDEGVPLLALGAWYVTALVIVWLVPSGATTFTDSGPATAGGAITASEAGALLVTMVAGWPPINTDAPDGMAVP